MNILSSALSAIQPSATIEMSRRAAELRAEGLDVISLATGEADFDTPPHIIDATIDALRRGETRYTAVDGTAALKTAIIDKLRIENGLEYSPAEIVAANGAKHIIALAMQATLNPGDEVLISAPYWPSYPEIVRLYGGKPVILMPRPNDRYKLTPEVLRSAISPRTKWLILNNPVNPTGAGYSMEEMQALGDVLSLAPHIHVLSDEIYEKIVFGDFRMISFASAVPTLRERTLTVNGMSKSYAMTGFRLGYGAGPAKLSRAMATIMSQTTSNPSAPSQAAAIAALSGPQDYLDGWRRSFEERTHAVAKRLNSLPGISCLYPEGAYYLFPNISGLIGKTMPDGATITDDLAFTRFLLDKHALAVVPGVSFGMANHFRLTCSASADILDQTCARIDAAVKTLK